jgi:hypothetical protein
LPVEWAASNFACTCCDRSADLIVLGVQLIVGIRTLVVLVGQVGSANPFSIEGEVYVDAWRDKVRRILTSNTHVEVEGVCRKDGQCQLSMQ